MDLSHLGLDEFYFENKELFNLNHITDNLPTTLTSDYLIEYKTRLDKSLIVVTSKLSELILSRQPTYIDELQRIANLQKSITDSIRVCSQGRECLGYMKEGIAKKGTTIAEHYKKRESLMKLLESLTTISGLKNSVIEIRSLIDTQEDFPKALQMCIDGKALLAQFQHFKCVNGLDFMLDHTIELIGDQVDNALSNICLSYNPDTYQKLQAAYNLLDRNINKRALVFFNGHHKTFLDELKLFLDNETWDMIPINGHFELIQLREYSFLRTNSQGSSEDLDMNKEEFVLQEDDGDTEGFEDLDEEQQYQRYLGIIRNKGPVLTNSSLHVLRLIGKYIQLMTGLQVISYDILMKIYELLDYYIRYVFQKFGPEGDKKSEDKTLRTVIRSIRESLVSSSQFNQHHSVVITSVQGLSPRSDDIVEDKPISVNLQKTIAVESLIFLVNQLWNIQEYLESLIPANLKPQLKEQFSQPNSNIPDFLKARAEL